MKKIDIFSVIALIAILSMAVFPQQVDNDATPKGGFVANNCDHNIRRMSLMAQESNVNKTIIIISYLGKDETEKFNKRRLHNSKTFMTQPYHKRDESLIITAQGERVKGDGFLDFFIGGVLEYRVLLPKNRDLILSGCQTEPEVKPCSTDYENLFYPCLEKRKNKNR